MDFVCKLYGNTYAVHVTVALVGVATLNLALPAPLKTIYQKFTCNVVILEMRALQYKYSNIMMPDFLVLPVVLINKTRPETRYDTQN